MTSTTAPAFTHSADCDSLTIGRLVQQLHCIGMTEQPAPVEDALSVLEYLISTANADHDRPCDCGRLALSRIEDQLRIARKADRAYHADAGRLFVADPAMVNALTFRITELVGQRNAIRAELAR